MTTRATLTQSRHGVCPKFRARTGGMAMGGVYTHMLRQAAAMLIPFPTALTAKFGDGRTLAFPFD